MARPLNDLAGLPQSLALLSVPPWREPVSTRDGQPRRAPITYAVTGTPGGAQVTWGPSGSDFTGSVPMNVAKPLGDPEYYAITAQLQGGGTVSCSMSVDGQPVSTTPDHVGRVSRVPSGCHPLRLPCPHDC